MIPEIGAVNLHHQTSDSANAPKIAHDQDNESSAGEEPVKPCKQRRAHPLFKASLERSVDRKRKSTSYPAGRGKSLGFGKDGSLRSYMNSKRRELFGSDSEDEESVPVALANVRGLTRESIQAGKYKYMKNADDGEDYALDVRDVSSSEEDDPDWVEQDTDSESNSRRRSAADHGFSRAASANMQAVSAETEDSEENANATQSLELTADSVLGETSEPVANADTMQNGTGRQSSEDVPMTEAGLPEDNEASNHQDEDLIVKAEECEESLLHNAVTSTPSFPPTIVGSSVRNAFRRSATMSDHESAYIS